MPPSRITPLLAAGVAALAQPATAARMSARAIPGFQLACSRYGHDHAAVKNVGRATVPGGTRIRLEATGGQAGAPSVAFGELHSALKPGRSWSSIARLPTGFTACEAAVDGARPL